MTSASYLNTWRNTFSPNGCGWYSFPSGVVRSTLILTMVFATISIIMSMAKLQWTMAAVLTASLLISTSFQLYINYYLVEGCHAVKMLNRKQQDMLDHQMHINSHHHEAPIEEEQN